MKIWSIGFFAKTTLQTRKIIVEMRDLYLWMVEPARWRHAPAATCRQLGLGRGYSHTSWFSVPVAGRPNQEGAWHDSGGAGRHPVSMPARAPLWSPHAGKLRSSTTSWSFCPVTYNKQNKSSFKTANYEPQACYLSYEKAMDYPNAKAPNIY